MRIPRVKTFCCLSLRTGSCIAIFLGVITSIISLLGVNELEFMNLELKTVLNDRDPEIRRKISSSSKNDNMALWLFANILQQAEEIIKYPNALAKLVGCIIAMYGVEKRKQSLLLPVLLRDSIVLGEFALSVGIILFMCLASNLLELGILVIFRGAIVFGVNAYLSIVMYSHYCQLYEERKEGIDYLVRV